VCVLTANVLWMTTLPEMSAHTYTTYAYYLHLLPIFMFIKKTVNMPLETKRFKYDILNPKNMKTYYAK